MSPKAKVQIKAMERTTRALLMNIYRRYHILASLRKAGDANEKRRNENSPMAGRIKVYVDRLIQARMDIFDEGSTRKRGLPSEPIDGLDGAKRRRLGAGLPERASYAPLPPGPNSLKDLYTLTKDPAFTNFDVTPIPLDLMTRIVVPVLQRVDQQAFDQAIHHVRVRYDSLAKANPALPQVGALGDDEEDYEPDFQPIEDREQVLNKADALPLDDSLVAPTEVALGPFELPQPAPLTAEETELLGKGTISRIFSMINVLEEPSAAKRQKSGLNRLAGSNYDREAWVTFVTRLATRASAGLHDVHGEDEDSKAVAKRQGGPSNLNDGIRDTLARYIREDFRPRIPIAIAWLSEEWFNDRMQVQAAGQQARNDSSTQPRRNYEVWLLRVLDGIVPFLDAKDKLLTRFLGEIPEVNESVLERVKALARDPERVQLAVTTLLYASPQAAVTSSALSNFTAGT